MVAATALLESSLQAKLIICISFFFCFSETTKEASTEQVSGEASPTAVYNSKGKRVIGRKTKQEKATQSYEKPCQENSISVQEKAIELQTSPQTSSVNHRKRSKSATSLSKKDNCFSFTWKEVRSNSYSKQTPSDYNIFDNALNKEKDKVTSNTESVIQGVRRKRGRPKGSKNRNTSLVESPQSLTSGADNTEQDVNIKQGRPKGPRDSSSSTEILAGSLTAIGSIKEGEKRKRGRPKGSGSKNSSRSNSPQRVLSGPAGATRSRSSSRANSPQPPASVSKSSSDTAVNSKPLSTSGGEGTSSNVKGSVATSSVNAVKRRANRKRHLEAKHRSTTEKRSKKDRDSPESKSSSRQRGLIAQTAKTGGRLSRGRAPHSDRGAERGGTTGSCASSR